MEARYSTIQEPATSEYVLAVLRDMHRQQSQFDPAADGDASLSFKFTVAEWRSACDLRNWKGLGRALNQTFGIKCSDSEWHAVLEPACLRKLSNVCAFIARRARRPRVRPSKMFGCTCIPAGAFLTVRSMLDQAGANADEIMPSTSLAPYTRRYYDLFLGPVSQLAPGALPLVRIRTPVYNAATWGDLAGLLCLLFGFFSSLHLLTIVGAVLLVLAYLLTWIAAWCLLPASVDFGELRTFRDLAVALSGSVGP
jgi:hypothetical protein